MRALAPNESLRFHKGSHRYFLGKRELPSVTTILGVVFPFDAPEEIAKPARERGTAVHLACQLDDERDLVEESVREELRPYLAAWRSFRRQTGFESDLIEYRCYHESLFYAGTIDRVGRIGSRKFVLDIKTGGKYPQHPLQLAGYANLLADPLGYSRGTVTLDTDACFSFTEFPREDFPVDLAVFRSCLNIYNFKLKHKLL